MRYESLPILRARYESNSPLPLFPSSHLPSSHLPSSISLSSLFPSSLFPSSLFPSSIFPSSHLPSSADVVISSDARWVRSEQTDRPQENQRFRGNRRQKSTANVPRVRPVDDLARFRGQRACVYAGEFIGNLRLSFVYMVHLDGESWPRRLVDA